ncbi:MAG TPA: thiamine diphosphokinase [Mucilaginibacter sp.]|jgi:thiamine pyrophosphokinase
MSSHHIVREKQEPALLVLGLDNFPEEQLGQLLEWSPTVITTLHTAEKLNSYGIKIDWIVTNDESQVLQSDIKLVPAGKQTLVKAALQYLIAQNYPAVNIITDELALTEYAGFSDKISLVIFNCGKRIFPVTPGFSKWKPTEETIEVISPFNHLDYTGLKNIGEKLFKTTGDGFFTLQFDEPFLFISEEL